MTADSMVLADLMQRQIGAKADLYNLLWRLVAEFENELSEEHSACLNEWTDGASRAWPVLTEAARLLGRIK